MTDNELDSSNLEAIAHQRSKIKFERRQRKIGSVLNLARRRVRNRTILYNERAIFILVCKTLCQINSLRTTDADTYEKYKNKLPRFFHQLADAVYENRKWKHLKAAFGLEMCHKNKFMASAGVVNKNSMSEMSSRTRFAIIKLIFTDSNMFRKFVTLSPAITLFKLHSFYSNKSEQIEHKKSFKLMNKFIEKLPKEAQF